MTAATPPEVVEARVVEEVARAMVAHELGIPPEHVGPSMITSSDRARAADAVAVYRATQDGGAEEKVRRVEALAAEYERSQLLAHPVDVANGIRAALAAVDAS